MLLEKALKILDQKRLLFHQSNNLEKYNKLSFENVIDFKNNCLIYKVVNGLTPPQLSTYFEPRTDRVLVPESPPEEI